MRKPKRTLAIIMQALILSLCFSGTAYSDETKKTEYELLYQSEVRKKLLEYLFIPNSLREEKGSHKIVVNVTVDKNGELLAANFTERSGSEKIDDFVYNAILEMELPAPNLHEQASSISADLIVNIIL